MKFRAIAEPEDFRKCHDLMAKEGFPKQELGHPTVIVTEDDGKLIGFVSTEIQDDMVVAGPMVMQMDKIRPFTVMNLMSVYEDVMKSLGIKRFIFWVDNSLAFARGIRKYFPEMKPYASEGTKDFYIRVVREDEEVFRTRIH